MQTCMKKSTPFWLHSEHFTVIPIQNAEKHTTGFWTAVDLTFMLSLLLLQQYILWLHRNVNTHLKTF